MRTDEITKSALNGFTGSGVKHQHGMWRTVCYSDGAKFLVDNGAAWLIDAVASHLMFNKSLQRKMKADEGLLHMSFWDLKLNGKGGATLTCVRDEGEKSVVRQGIEYTDCPIDIRLYVGMDSWDHPDGGLVNGWMIYLPSEY